MDNISQEEVAKIIAEMINKEVSKLNHDDQKWKYQYEYVMEELEREINYTEELIEDFTESKLSFNKIEQEGYLRCLKTMVKRFRDWERY